MPTRSVLVLGNSPRAAGLLEELDRDPLSQTHPGLPGHPELPDLVILAGAEEEHLAVALSLLESDRTLLVVAGPHLDHAVVHRLALVADDADSPVRCWLPAVAGLEPVGDSIGTVQALRLDRADNRPADDLLFDDLARLARLAGRFDQVTATLGPSASVNLSADNGTTAAWTLRPTSGPAQAQLLLGDTPLELDRDDRPDAPGRWTEVATGTSHLELDELVDLVETFAAVQESSRRRRTIDLHHEPTSERTVFKSQMSAVGCLLLLLTLLGLVALLVLGALLDPTNTRGGRADRVGFLLEQHDFQAEFSSLSESGEKHLDRIAGRAEHVHIPIVVAATSNKALDIDRRTEVEAQLDRRGIRVAQGRIVIDTPPAAWTQALLKIARIAWIAPLVLFLILQGLILATRGRPDPETAAPENPNP